MLRASCSAVRSARTSFSSCSTWSASNMIPLAFSAFPSQKAAVASCNIPITWSAMWSADRARRPPGGAESWMLSREIFTA